MVRVTETAWTLSFEQVDHTPDRLPRSEHLICLLQWNIAKNILRLIFVEPVCELLTQVQENPRGIVEDGFVEKMPLSNACFRRSCCPDSRRIRAGAELLRHDACDVFEHCGWNQLVEVGKRGVPVAVGHEERRDGAREPARTVARFVLDIVLRMLLSVGSLVSRLSARLPRKRPSRNSRTGVRPRFAFARSAY